MFKKKYGYLPDTKNIKLVKVCGEVYVFQCNGSVYALEKNEYHKLFKNCN